MPNPISQPRRIVSAKPLGRPLDRRPQVLGRLLSIASSFDSVANYLSSNKSQDSDEAVVIHFPSMPESIELARKAEYNQSSAPFTPDGIHLYKKTNPMEIQLAFSLHHKDPFCAKGGLSLLVMAAKLHSLILPINNSSERRNVSVTVGPYYSAASTGTDQTGKPPATSKDSTAAGTPAAVLQDPTVAFNGTTGQSTTANPPACLLDLISVGDRDGAPGVRCYGYVSAVSVKFRGPWMRGFEESGPNGIRNVPTAADYSFTFVHAPGFSNFFSGSSSLRLSGLSAFAGDVLKNFYNTVPLTEGQDEKNSYVGLNEQPILSEIPVTTVTPPPDIVTQPVFRPH